MNKKFGVFTSSVDPSQISLTVESVVRIIGLMVGGYGAIKGSHVVIDNTVIQQTTDALVAVITSGIVVWQSANLLFGLFRKVVTAYNSPAPTV